MAESNEPIIKLEPGGKASVLNYNVPEPTSYAGRSVIELDFPDEYFEDDVKRKPPERERAPLKDIDFPTLRTAVFNGMASGFASKELFPNIQFKLGGFRYVGKGNPIQEIKSSLPVSSSLALLDPDEIAYKMQEGMRLNVYTSLYGKLKHNFIPEPSEKITPRILIIESYRLSSFLGNYGAGRTIKTFSLLPGEKTKISVKSYTKRETESKDSSSILDSFTEESADDFEESVMNEQSSKENVSESFEYHAEAEAGFNWGWGNAKVSGGIKGSTNSAREEFAKNVTNATQKHTSKASAKRDVQINTSYEVKEEEGTETSIEREIENINVSRTLNFVFRQMNQEFITLLHLVDIRVAFFNGYAESKREVSLPELDSLIEEVIVEEHRKEVKESVLEALGGIFDYKDNPHTFIEEREFIENEGTSKFWRVKKDYLSTYTDEATDTEITVPGIILSANKYTLRTDGVIVEAILGQGDALDTYSHKLQDEAVKTKQLSNALMQTDIDKNKLGMKIVQDRDADAADIYGKVFSVPKEEEEEENG